MPHALWSGAISFGLVTIPVKVTSATEDHSVRFHQVHLEDMGRVRVRKVCETEDREVSAEEIGKGYEWSKDQVIPVTDDELAEMPLPTAKAIEILGFVPYESVDAVKISDGYYLETDGKVADKPYVLLREALARSGKAGVAKFAWHGRERLGLLRIRGNTMVLHALRWDDEVRDPSELRPGPVELTEKEVEEALVLVDRMGLEGLEGFADTYTEALEAVIEAKREGHEPPKTPAPEAAPGEVVDLMSALEQSVARARSSRGEDEGTVHDIPKKKAPAKKTAQRKTGAKKTTAKKTEARTTRIRPRSA
ncbi:non-homologous end joining protein Ku [Streptomyces capitiformicae]|uniref:Non-homologous end joining protein Ku n=1 Tax=Streptomyces capitiformicae TaxID=2014920 RepID=A0A918ZH51_9ACTN|nr:Ku protein [Streptomyces capitiformicae]GHE51394.1 non-homologous end joining protein Ku [Streptomyces capitiformicae]